MEFKPESSKKKEDELIDNMWNDLRSSSDYKSKTQEELQEAWDKRKAEESKKFDPANVEQVEMFSDEDFE